jgi:DNA topoisomerase-1
MSTVAKRQPRRSKSLIASQTASDAGLRYMTDRGPGIRRLRRGRGFRYVDAHGEPLDNPDDLARIKSLVIPPAWENVWICPSPIGHIQATGYDKRGRKQYRYHARWRAVRDEAKYDRVMAFGRALPKIRERTERDLARPGLPRAKVLATVVQLLDRSLIRVGNDEYARTNHSYGLTTMRDKHVALDGGTIRFAFDGKSRVHHTIDVRDRQLARIVARCQELPGQELFQYIDDAGVVQDIDSADVNDYIHAVAGSEFTAKDFRTWAGTVLATMALQEFAAFDSQVQAKKNLVRAIAHVAQRLGNTPTVCRKCYIHPAVLAAYLDGSMIEALRHRTEQAIDESLGDLRPEEAMVLVLLQRRLAREDDANSRRRPRASATRKGTRVVHRSSRRASTRKRVG